MAEEYVEVGYVVQGVDLGERVPSDPIEPVRRLGRSWGLTLFLGIVTLAVGVVITFRPASQFTSWQSSSGSGYS